VSAEIDDGGPAFPQPLAFDPANGNPVTTAMYFANVSGMTLRDWFAGQALAGLVANINCAYKTQTFAKRALELADAMIAARKGGTDGNR
jgi:hypothetical protein